MKNRVTEIPFLLKINLSSKLIKTKVKLTDLGLVKLSTKDSKSWEYANTRKGYW